MYEIMSKQFEGHDVRTALDENGQIWISTQDLLDILGIKYKNSAMKRIDSSEMGKIKSSTLGGIQEISAVSESGMYKLILRSDKPNAQKFTNFVTREVLPQIRKSGSFNPVPLPVLSPAKQLLAYAQRMADQEDQINHVVKEVERVEKLAMQEDDTLTHDQITELSALIGSLKEVNSDPKNCGKAMAMLKIRWGLTRMNTWKEMPRHGFEEAKKLVISYKENLAKQATLF